MPPFFCSGRRFGSAVKLAVLIFLACMIWGCFNAGESETEIDAERIVHGGGTLWEVDSMGVYRAFSGSNSREGLMRCAENGADFVELDFSMTADGELVCIHGWNREYIRGITEGVPLALDAFRQSRIYGCFTPMTAADAAEILEGSGMTLVADIKGEFEDCAVRLAEVFSDLRDAVVVQIFSEEQYEMAAELGFCRIAYTLYRLDWDEKLNADAHISFARENPLEWIAFSEELLSNGLFLEKMLSSGVPLYVHTVNDEKTVQYLLDIGITGVYTDYIK